jgi:Flp pilus assembly protein TadG
VLLRRVLSALRGNERGTAMVEFALVALPLFMLVGGIVDFARAMNYYNDLTQLAGQGARAAIVAGNPDGTAPNGATSVQCQLIRKYATTQELRGTNSTNGLQVQILDPSQATQPATVNPAYGQPLEVKTSFNFQFIVPLVRIGIPGGFLGLNTSSTMRVEQRAATAFSTTPQNVTTCP